MSESDMADKMKRPISTVKWWLRAARERMALLLKATRSFEDQD
jgi:DNA-directed RNA polymerase specialized sigma24 family protein